MLRGDGIAYHQSAITPSDGGSHVFSGLYIGVGGTLVVEPRMDESGGTDSVTTVTFENVPDGSLLPIGVQRVLSTGTTASSILGLK